MKKIIFSIAIILASSYAAASCPVMTKYQCFPAGNGKMNCGCY